MNRINEENDDEEFLAQRMVMDTLRRYQESHGEYPETIGVAKNLAKVLGLGSIKVVKATGQIGEVAEIMIGKTSVKEDPSLPDGVCLAK